MWSLLYSQNQIFHTCVFCKVANNVVTYYIYEISKHFNDWMHRHGQKTSKIPPKCFFSQICFLQFSSLLSIYIFKIQFSKNTKLTLPVCFTSWCTNCVPELLFGLLWLLARTKFNNPFSKLCKTIVNGKTWFNACESAEFDVNLGRSSINS